MITYSLRYFVESLSCPCQVLLFCAGSLNTIHIKHQGVILLVSDLLGHPENLDELLAKEQLSKFLTSTLLVCDRFAVRLELTAKLHTLCVNVVPPKVFLARLITLNQLA